jgi:hypothetical protein
MHRIAITVSVVIGVVIIAAGALFLSAQHSNSNGLLAQIPVTSAAPAAASSPSDGSPTTTPPLSQSVPVTQELGQGMRLYKNPAFHFSLSYPDNLQATDYQEAGGALTASFQDPSTDEGFEVYVTPYSGTQIGEARFKLDEPSGTFEDPTNVVIDGVTATMFYGYNPIMSDTREVWFIRDGMLYEVATYKQLDSWLGGIMQTWRFI